jgi:hypothetical protein
MAAEPQDAPRHGMCPPGAARRNIAVDEETAQLVVAAVQAAL